MIKFWFVIIFSQILHSNSWEDFFAGENNSDEELSNEGILLSGEENDQSNEEDLQTDQKSASQMPPNPLSVTNLVQAGISSSPKSAGIELGVQAALGVAGTVASNNQSVAQAIASAQSAVTSAAEPINNGISAATGGVIGGGVAGGTILVGGVAGLTKWAYNKLLGVRDQATAYGRLMGSRGRPSVYNQIKIRRR